MASLCELLGSHKVTPYLCLLERPHMVIVRNVILLAFLFGGSLHADPGAEWDGPFYQAEGIAENRLLVSSGSKLCLYDVSTAKGKLIVACREPDEELLAFRKQKSFLSLKKVSFLFSMDRAKSVAKLDDGSLLIFKQLKKPLRFSVELEKFGKRTPVIGELSHAMEHSGETTVDIYRSAGNLIVLSTDYGSLEVLRISASALASVETDPKEKNELRDNFLRSKQLRKDCTKEAPKACLDLANWIIKRGEDSPMPSAKIACEGGLMQGCNIVGQLWMRRKTSYKAVPYFSKSCENQDKQGCLLYSEFFAARGNTSKARSFRKKACDLGEISACEKR